MAESTDVVIKLGKSRFKCCRSKLAKKSAYFRAMFSENFVEKDMKVIEIHDVSAQAMKILLKYVEKPPPVGLLAQIDPLILLTAACFLQFEDMEKWCEFVIVHKWLTIKNCLRTMITANDLNLPSMSYKAKVIAMQEFSKLKFTDEFKSLNICNVIAYLSNDGLQLREGEFEVFDAIVNWLETDLNEKLVYALDLIKVVRFISLSILDVRMMLLMPYLTEDKDVRTVLEIIVSLKYYEHSKLIKPRTNEDNSESVLNESSILLNELVDKVSQNSDSIESACCDPLRLVKNCVTRCADICTESPQNTNQVETSTDDEISFPDYCDISIDSELYNIALECVSKGPRRLPLVPCIVGHICCQNSSKSELSNEGHVKACIIYFDYKKQKPVPFLEVAKVNGGPVEPTGFRVVNRGQDFYVFGGEHLRGFGQWNSTVWKYDAWDEVWTCETRLLTPRRHHSVCILDQSVYVIGGFGRHRVILSSVHRYELNTKTWTKCASLPSSVYSTAVCVHKRLIYVFGFEVYCYYPDNDFWFILKERPIPNNIGFNCAMTYRDCIFLTGTYSRDLFKYYPTYRDNRECNYEHMGSFKYQPCSTCLIHDVIYAFSQNEENNHLIIETYNISTGIFAIVWEAAKGEECGIIDFSHQHSFGCFPFVMYS